MSPSRVSHRSWWSHTAQVLRSSLWRAAAEHHSQGHAVLWWTTRNTSAHSGTSYVEGSLTSFLDTGFGEHWVVGCPDGQLPILLIFTESSCCRRCCNFNLVSSSVNMSTNTTPHWDRGMMLMIRATDLISLRHQICKRCLLWPLSLLSHQINNFFLDYIKHQDRKLSSTVLL